MRASYRRETNDILDASNVQPPLHPLFQYKPGQEGRSQEMRPVLPRQPPSVQGSHIDVGLPYPDYPQEL